MATTQTPTVCGNDCQNVLPRHADYCSEACAEEDGAPKCDRLMGGCGCRLGVEDRTPGYEAPTYLCDDCTDGARESACYVRDVMGVAL